MESPVDHRREFAVYSSGSGKPSPLWATPHPRIVFASDSSLHMRHLGYYQVWLKVGRPEASSNFADNLPSEMGQSHPSLLWACFLSGSWWNRTSSRITKRFHLSCLLCSLGSAYLDSCEEKDCEHCPGSVGECHDRLAMSAMGKEKEVVTHSSQNCTLLGDIAFYESLCQMYPLGAPARNKSVRQVRELMQGFPLYKEFLWPFSHQS